MRARGGEVERITLAEYVVMITRSTGEQAPMCGSHRRRSPPLYPTPQDVKEGILRHFVGATRGLGRRLPRVRPAPFVAQLRGLVPVLVPCAPPVALLVFTSKVALQELAEHVFLILVVCLHFFGTTSDGWRSLPLFLLVQDAQGTQHGRWFGRSVGIICDDAAAEG